MFRNPIITALGLAFAWTTLAAPAAAQRGTGEPTGVARQAIVPEIVTLSGKLVKVQTAPCENTTGPSELGTHVLLEPQEGEPLNIHLGPAGQVAFVADALSVGDRITVRAFRTDRMKEGHYVAQTIAWEDDSVRLRDSNLRPLWAGGRGNWARTPEGRGGGWSGGRGYGYRQGRGYGYGYQQGRGSGYGSRQGRGYGRGGGRW